jgi:hypothetical protein
MYNPAFKLSPSGVPILSKEQMERIAEKYIRDFMPEILQSCRPLPVDDFCEGYQKLNVDYPFLSNNGCYLGMAVLGDQTRVTLYELETNSIRNALYNARTILIDRSLLDEEKDEKLRFTIMHECSHQILHANYFRIQEAQGMERRILCRQETIEKKNSKPFSEWTDTDRMEWQANYLAAALLMPTVAVRDCMDAYQIREYYEARIHEGMHEETAFTKAAMELVYAFRVSLISAKIRLMSLDFPRLRRDV